MTASLTPDEALRIARFVRPRVKAEPTSCLGVWGARYEDGEEWFPSHSDIAAAERVLVERGLAFRYGVVLLEELGLADKGWPEDVAAEIRTAPLEVCLRAMARVVREQPKPKETEA